MTATNIREALLEIQSKLHAPKNQLNKFGGYNYRSCEDILEALKPLLKEVGAILTITDEIVLLGERFYVKAHATLTLGDESVVVSAFAREPEDKKGSDASQITGAASSYARKYALNGLFLIDDAKDADTNESHQSQEVPNPPAPRARRTPTKKGAADLIPAAAAEGLIGDDDYEMLTSFMALMKASPAVVLNWLSVITGRSINHPRSLTQAEAELVLDKITESSASGVNPFTGEVVTL